MLLIDRKECNRCGVIKDFSEFHSKSACCRACKRAVDQGRVRHRTDRSETNWGEKAKQRKRRWAASHRDPCKELARRAVRAAVEKGILMRPEVCSLCGAFARRVDGAAAIQAHHHAGYERPIEVQWLCPKCHVRVERDAARSTPAKGGEQK